MITSESIDVLHSVQMKIMIEFISSTLGHSFLFSFLSFLFSFLSCLILVDFVYHPSCRENDCDRQSDENQNLRVACRPNEEKEVEEEEEGGKGGGEGKGGRPQES